jgi:hypothetical protein
MFARGLYTQRFRIAMKERAERYFSQRLQICRSHAISAWRLATFGDVTAPEKFWHRPSHHVAGEGRDNGSSLGSLAPQLDLNVLARTRHCQQASSTLTPRQASMLGHENTATPSRRLACTAFLLRRGIVDTTAFGLVQRHRDSADAELQRVRTSASDHAEANEGGDVQGQSCKKLGSSTQYLFPNRVSRASGTHAGAADKVESLLVATGFAQRGHSKISDRSEVGRTRSRSTSPFGEGVKSWSECGELEKTFQSNFVRRASADYERQLAGAHGISKHDMCADNCCEVCRDDNTMRLIKCHSSHPPSPPYAYSHANSCLLSPALFCARAPLSGMSKMFEDKERESRCSAFASPPPKSSTRPPAKSWGLECSAFASPPPKSPTRPPVKSVGFSLEKNAGNSYKGQFAGVRSRCMDMGETKTSGQMGNGAGHDFAFVDHFRQNEVERQTGRECGANGSKNEGLASAAVAQVGSSHFIFGNTQTVNDAEFRHVSPPPCGVNPSPSGISVSSVLGRRANSCQKENELFAGDSNEILSETPDQSKPLPNFSRVSSAQSLITPPTTPAPTPNCEGQQSAGWSLFLLICL